MNTNSQPQIKNDVNISFDNSYAQYRASKKALEIEADTESWLAKRALAKGNSLAAQTHMLKAIKLKEELEALNKTKGKKHG